MVWPNLYQNIMDAAIVRTLNGVSYQILCNAKELFGTFFYKGAEDENKKRKYQIRSLMKIYFVIKF